MDTEISLRENKIRRDMSCNNCICEECVYGRAYVNWWRPDEQTYYYVNDIGGVYMASGKMPHLEATQYGNYFKTAKQAKDAAKLISVVIADYKTSLGTNG